MVCGVDAAEPKTARRLLEEYDAILLCCGAGVPRPLGFDTAGVGGVCYGTEYLKSAVERAQFGKEETPVPSAAGLDVVIIGTGDTASDCVATALRQGCRSVTQLVRRPRADYLDKQGQLPLDYAHEEAEAVLGTDPRRFGVQVQSLVTSEGALTAVVTTEGDTLPCQLLIGATGFAGCESDVCRAFGVEVDRTVHTLPGSFSTGVDKVFAARRHAPWPVPGGMGHCGGPLRRRGDRPVPDRLYQFGHKSIKSQEFSSGFPKSLSETDD